MKAAELWNKGKTSRRDDTLDLPTVDVKVTTAPIIEKRSHDLVGPPVPVPVGTRVHVISPATPAAHGQIRVVDGPLTGKAIEIDATDMAALKDERK